MIRDALNAKGIVTFTLIVPTEGHSITEIEGIDQIHLETSEEEEEIEKQATVLALDMGEMLLLRRLLHTMEGS